MYDDVKHVVPDDYVNKHISTKMRQKKFRAEVANTWMTFKVVSKVDRNFLTRDILKIKQKISHLITAMTNNRKKATPSEEIYNEVIAAVYDKQVADMGKQKISLKP